MAITQTGAIYKAFSFDNVSSRDFGVYITSEAVYNAPERDVEMISIPGRNGAFALDRGRFENIEVKYPAGIFADNETDFAQAVSDLRNYLCSKKGYFRLTDEYNPNEYRMAVYKSGLEVSPVQLKAGEFEIIFECKPQRWLTSGETAVTVTSGGTITNPTRFESSPMLEVKGYGNIEANGSQISIEYAPLGKITLWDKVLYNYTPTAEPLIRYKTFETEKVNTGDSLNYGLSSESNSLAQNTASFYIFNDEYSFHVGTSVGSGTLPIKSTNVFTVKSSDYEELRQQITPSEVDFIVGTSASYSYTLTRSGTTENKTTQSTFAYEIRLTFTVAYDGDNKITITAKREIINDDAGVISLALDQNRGYQLGYNRLEANSTVLAFGNPTYIDCDLGEAYMIKNGVPVSLNQYIDLGSELPTLAAGANTITFDNTVTDLKVIPRWWKV